MQTLHYRGRRFLFLARHGADHGIAPHKINYRANIQVLKDLGVSQILAVNAVGGIGPRYGAGVIAIPDQLNDYTWGREHSFYDGGEAGVEHIDFTYPYSENLRQRLVQSADRLQLQLQVGGVYAATQGPRLETAAEVRRLARDGNDLVGMTGMPEAALARERGLDYASVCLVVNPAAGQTEDLITMDDIRKVLATGMDRVKALLAECIAGE